MPAPQSIFLDFRLPNATTWFYFSFLLAVALAAMGLETSVRKLRSAGVRPFLLGSGAWGFISMLSLLLIRSMLSQMDVHTRTSYVMAVVSPGERAAAASITSVPRSLASAVSPLIAGYLLGLSSFGWPLLIAGGLKIAYDLLLLATFRTVRPPEETPLRT